MFCEWGRSRMYSFDLCIYRKSFCEFGPRPSRATPGSGKPLLQGPIITSFRMCRDRDTGRELQQGPANHYCRALSLPHSECAGIEMLKAPEGRNVETGEGCPLTIRLGIFWGASNSPAGSRAEPRPKWSVRSHLVHAFQYFWAMAALLAGPQTLRSPGKLFPFPPFRRACYCPTDTENIRMDICRQMAGPGVWKQPNLIHRNTTKAELPFVSHKI